MTKVVDDELVREAGNKMGRTFLGVVVKTIVHDGGRGRSRSREGG